MPKENAQEAKTTQSSQNQSEVESSEQESTQEAQEANEQTEEKGFFGRITQKAKEATSELFATDKDEQESQKDEAKTHATPKKKSILKKGVKFASVTAFIYKGEGSFTLKIGAYPYIIESGEVFIVPNDKTAQYLRYKEQLFSEIID